MVEPTDVERILSDAARLVGEGEIVVFGSAALALSLSAAPPTRDVDLWCDPPERGDALTALMGELSWYHERHGAWVEVWAPETFTAPVDWRARARIQRHEDHPGVSVVIPHPHDVLISKLERFEEKDREHAKRILAEYPLDEEQLQRLLGETPHRLGTIGDSERVNRFEHGVQILHSLVTPK